MKDNQHYGILAEMFRYPSEQMKSYTEAWMKLVQDYDEGLIDELEPFVRHVLDKPLNFQEEYFVSTFDVQPVCFLDIGYTLFGEDYRRGQFMANLSREHKRAGNDCGMELPDHLPNVLSLISKMNEGELAEELICSLLIPAVEKMISSFRNRRNHYRGLLMIVLAIMKKDYPDNKYERYVVRTVTKSNEA